MLFIISLRRFSQVGFLQAALRAARQQNIKSNGDQPGASLEESSSHSPLAVDKRILGALRKEIEMVNAANASKDREVLV